MSRRPLLKSISILLLALAALAQACSNDPPPSVEPPAPQADAGVSAIPPGPVVPLTVPAREIPFREEAKIYPRLAGEAVDAAIYMGAYEAMAALSRKLDPVGAEHNGAPTGAAKAVERPKGTLLSLWYTGNVHGEREDCGCKKNPLGGLTRKATMIQDAPKAGRELDRPDGQLILDAGDLLFAGTHVSRLSETDHKIALIQAEAIVMAFNLIGCAAFSPGEVDLALGLEALLGLKGKAKFPWVSANMRRASDKALIFEPFVVTEAAGLKTLIVGLTNPESAIKDYYVQAGVEIQDPAEALKAQAEAIRGAGADVVILLSNLGIEGTSKLLEGLDRGALPVTLALVSNTSRSTYTPIWVAGVPIFEPGSRGKFMGRADLHVVDGKVAFVPEESGQVSLVRDYMNAYRSLHHARRAVSEIVNVKTPSAPLKADAGVEAALEDPDAARNARIERNLTLAAERLKRIEEGLPAKIDVVATPVETQSWIFNQVTPVELSIVQDKAVRRLLDDYEKKVAPLRPAPPK